MNTACAELYTLPARGTSAPPMRLLDLARRSLDRLALWQQRAAQRRALAALPDELLKDIGVSRADAMIEASKPFWRR